MVGTEGQPGRVLKALALASEWDVRVVADDAYDGKNGQLLERFGIENFRTAKRTQDEARSALDHSVHGRLLFVTSPDHLPRVVRDVLALGGTNALFCSSDVPFSEAGVGAVIVDEPPSRR